MIDPETFAGGRMKLDVDRARRAFAPLAARLGVSVVEAAYAVIGLVEANMINALKLVTIQRGHDPRDLTLVASGGGGPMHAATLGRELGVKRIVVPRYAGLSPPGACWRPGRASICTVPALLRSRPRRFAARRRGLSPSCSAKRRNILGKPGI